MVTGIYLLGRGRLGDQTIFYQVAFFFSFKTEKDLGSSQQSSGNIFLYSQAPSNQHMVFAFRTSSAWRNRDGSSRQQEALVMWGARISGLPTPRHVHSL